MPQFLITSPEGKKYKVTAPDGATQQDAIKFVQSGKVPEMQAPAAPQESQGFTANVSADLAKRGENIAEIRARTDAGQQPRIAEIIPMAGQAAMAGLDVVGEGLRAITPDPVADAVKSAVLKNPAVIGAKTVAKGVGAIPLPGGSNVSQAVTSGLGSAVNAYGEFKEAHPVIASNIEGVGNLAMAVTPAGKPAAKAGQTRAGDIAQGARAAAAKQVAESKNKYVTDLVRDVMKPADIAEAGMRGRVKETKLGSRVVELSKFEKDMASEVGKLDIKISKIPLKSDSKIVVGNKILKEADKEVKALSSALDAKKIAINKTQFKRGMLNKANKFVDDNAMFVGQPKEMAQKLLVQYGKILDSVPGTPAGLLQARKMFDAKVAEVKPQALANGSSNSFNMLVREIRTGTNDFIAAKVPDVAVKESLRKQHLLLSAAENVTEKYAKEQGNAIVRIADKVGKVVSTKAALGTTVGLAGTGAAAYLVPAIIPTAVIGGTAYAGAQALKSSVAKKSLATLLEGADKAIRLEKDKAVLSQLRADRAAVLEMMRSLPEEKEPEKPAIAVNPYTGK